MLTHHDRTVSEALEVVAEIAPLGLKHVGFKDEGADAATLRTLNAAIKASGAQSYMEIVATTPETALRGAALAASIGVDHLLGATHVAEILDLLRGTLTKFYPFPGTPIGHPTKLGGDAAQIATHTKTYLAQGCAGVDLLAYRAIEADPLDLVRAARQACGTEGRLICAGGVDNPARIAALAQAGADAFTIGSAVFDNSFASGVSGVTAQLKEILKCV